jgi:hypothetical protein
VKNSKATNKIEKLIYNIIRQNNKFIMLTIVKKKNIRVDNIGVACVDKGATTNKLEEKAQFHQQRWEKMQIFFFFFFFFFFFKGLKFYY